MNPAAVLNSHNLKRTSCREGIIDAMMVADQALSENEIREKLSGNYDRTTFYRSFKTLEKHKIVHKIVIDNQIIKYALDNSITNNKKHAHFYCNNCHSVLCLPTFPLKDFHLPEGYSKEETEIIIKGTCVFCNKNN